MTEVTIPSTAAKKLVIDPEFSALIAPLLADERQRLEESVLRDGCRDRLLVWEETGILVDGHNRFDICTANDIPFKTSFLSFADRDEAKLFILDNQLARRNLNRLDRIRVVEKREPLIKKAVAKNQGRRNDLPQNSAEGSEGRETREVAAAAAGVSHDTYSKGKRILEHGTPELQDAVRNDEVSIHAAAQVAELPAEEQRLVVADRKVKETAKELSNRRTESTGNVEWYTPAQFIEAARSALGEIDLDPASCAVAQRTVRAARYFDKDDDALTKPWSGRVWLNPPYARSLIGPFVEKLVSEVAAGNVPAAILLTNNETETQWFQLAASHAAYICFPDERIKFRSAKGSGGAPTQGQAFFYFRPEKKHFFWVFNAIGMVFSLVTPRATAGEEA